MYTTWPCPWPDGTMGEEMVLGFDGRREHRILVIAPLFDEANKFRHQIFEIMRRLDRHGIDCFLPDLPGCNESLAPHRGQTLANWRQATRLAAEHFRARHVFTVRSGGWITPNGLPGWLYAPADPNKFLRGMVRARILSAREQGRSQTIEDLMAEARENGINLSGWPLGPNLIRELENPTTPNSFDLTTLDHADVGGKPLWLRAENDVDAQQADTIVSRIAAGLSAA